MSQRDAAATPAKNSPVSSLAEGELRRTLSSHPGVGVWHIDTAGFTIFANASMLAMLGLASMDALRGRHYREFFPPESLDLIAEHQRRRGAGDASHYEARLIPASGEAREVQISGAPIFTAAGELTGHLGIFIDLSAQRQAERALRDSRAILSAAMESLPFDFWAIGPDGRYCLLNSTAREHWGDQLGRRPDEMEVPEAIRAIWLENNRRAMAGHLVKGEASFRVGDETRYVENIIAPIHHDGEVRGVVGVNIDITERKLAEQQRRAAHRQLQLFLDHNPALIFQKDIEGRYTLINRQFERCFGLPHDQILGRTDAELLSASVAAQFTANDRQVVERGTVLEFEETAEYGDGIHVSLVLKFPVRDASGAIIGVGGIATDITGRRIAEEGLRRSEERFRALIECARDAIITLDAEGNVTSLNAACEAMSGWSPSDWIGRSFVPAVLPEDQPLALAQFQKLLAGERPEPYELRGLRKDGSVIILEITATSFCAADESLGVLIIARDMTERKQLESGLRHAQKMESIGQLAGGVAHDFNNILTVIQGHAALLRETSGLHPDAADSVEQIADAADRAANLTRQLLAFSRRQLLRPKPVDLHTIVSEMSRMLRRILGEDIALHVVAGPSIPQVEADPGMIEQVLLNLAVNGRDAMPSGGTLTISTEVVVLDAAAAAAIPDAAPGRWVRLSVSDTGCGIPPELLPRIFEPFFTTKDVGRGTGLGLATVYGIVRQHHGWITVESEIERGAAFRIHLPALAQRREEHGAEPASDTALPGGSETILVVEDEAPVRALVRHFLDRLGYNVLEASTGMDALHVWEKHRGGVDLLLTDIIMPDGMSGRQLAEWLQLDRADLPVIYTSGYAAEAVSGNLTLHEGINFLQKPYPPAQLASIIRKALDAR
jgi:PAS domain S-box-containing protein